MFTPVGWQALRGGWLWPVASPPTGLLQNWPSTVPSAGPGPYPGGAFWEEHGKKGGRGTHSPRPPAGPAPLGPEQTPGWGPWAHLWVRTVWHSKACGKTASHHARQRARARGEGRVEAPWTPPPKVWRAPSPPAQPESGAHLSMAPRSQCLAAALTLQAKLVPILAQGAHLLSCGQEGASGPAVPGSPAPSPPWGCDLKQASCTDSQLSITPASIPSLTHISQSGLKGGEGVPLSSRLRRGRPVPTPTPPWDPQGTGRLPVYTWP